MEISIDQAYGEACKTIGEQAVTLRFVQAELTRVQTELEALREHLARRDEPDSGTD